MPLYLGGAYTTKLPHTGRFRNTSTFTRTPGGGGTIEREQLCLLSQSLYLPYCLLLSPAPVSLNCDTARGGGGVGGGKCDSHSPGQTQPHVGGSWPELGWVSLHSYSMLHSPHLLKKAHTDSSTHTAAQQDDSVLGRENLQTPFEALTPKSITNRLTSVRVIWHLKAFLPKMINVFCLAVHKI